MRTASSKFIVVAALILAAIWFSGILAARPQTASAQQPPTLRVSPSTAAPGETVILSGAGWSAGTPLVARLYQADEAITGASAPMAMAFEADAGGNLTAQGVVPNTLFGSGSRGSLTVVPGRYTIVVSAGPAPSASTAFFVGPSARSGMIWGQIVFDTNGNGQRDSTDLVAGSLAGLTATGPDGSTRQAITDARGRFLLFPVEPGVYDLSSETMFRSLTWKGSTSVTAARGEDTRVDLLLQNQSLPISAERFFAETGFAVDIDAFWDYFTHRGGVRTLGYPISRTFPFQGYQTQFFQRVILQDVPGQGVQRLNLLDPGLMPYTRINGSEFPAVDPEVKAATPSASDPAYDAKVIDFVRQYAPNEVFGRRAGFFDAFSGTVTCEDAFPEGPCREELLPLLNLEIWGVPISRPTADPGNSNFVYLRFQRGILHFQGYNPQREPITEGILLGDWFKSLITGWNLPADLEAQARADNSPFLRQYDPGQPGSLARPDRLPDTDLTLAFERQTP